MAASVGMRWMGWLNRKTGPFDRYEAVIAVTMLLGLILRLRGAVGDLWLDEVWTLQLVEPLSSPGDVFFNTPYSNNHFLNSLWIWFVGTEAAPLVLRGSAVALGALTPLAAAAASWRAGKTAAVVAALLFATSYYFVHYGSEARGYAGMILCVLIAKAAMDALVEQPPPPAAAWSVFGGAILFGLFFHLTMLASVAALGAVAVMKNEREGRLGRGVRVVLVAAVACAPASLLFLLNLLDPRYLLSELTPLSFATFAEGLGGVARTTLGLSENLSDVWCLALGVVLALLALPLLPASRRYFPIISVFLLPAFYVVFSVPNQFWPRFHAVTAIGLLLLVSEALAALMARGGAPRALAYVLLGLYGLGQAQALANFYRDARGSYSEAARFMTADGPATYTADAGSNEIVSVAAYAAKRSGAALVERPFGQLCEKPADWFIERRTPRDREPPRERLILSLPGGECARAYIFTKTFPAWGLSGFNWRLYRRAD